MGFRVRNAGSQADSNLFEFQRTASETTKTMPTTSTTTTRHTCNEQKIKSLVGDDINLLLALALGAWGNIGIGLNGQT